MLFTKSDIDVPIAERFSRVAAAYPDAIAVVDGNNTVTYAELEAKSNALANRLIEHTPEGTTLPVGILFSSHLESLIAHIAVFKAGLICVALDVSHPPKSLINTCKVMQVSIVVTNQDLSTLANMPVVEKILLTDTNDTPADSTTPHRIVDVESVAVMYVTSGSSGTPKGVMQSHKTLMHRIWCDAQHFNLDNKDRVSLLFSMSYAAALPDAMGALLIGGEVHAFNPRQYSFTELADWLKDNRITVFHPPVSLFRHFLSSLAESVTFPDCREIALGGQSVYRSDMALFTRHFAEHCALSPMYASSEVSVIARQKLTRSSSVTDDVIAVGFPLDGKHVSIVDEQMNPTDGNEPGEIVIDSEYMFKGYWQNPIATNQCLSQTGQSWRLLTGDLGRFDDNGALHYIGRKDAVVKIRGYRVSLLEIESAIKNFPDVVDVVALAADDSINACIQSSKSDFSIDDLRSFLTESAPAQMMPSRFRVFDQLPKTTSGKLDRRALASVDFSPPNAASNYCAPSTEAEMRCAEVWCRVLEVEHVGVTDSFFALGGDSLKAIRMITELERCLSRKITLPQLVQSPTIQSLLANIAAEGGALTSIALNSRKPNKAASRLFCVYGLFLYQQLADSLGDDIEVHGVYVNEEVQRLGFGDNPADFDPSVEKLASLYIEQIKSIQPRGPYNLAGSSFGGLVAFEMAQQLTDSGDEVSLLALFDALAPGARSPRSVRGLIGVAKDYWIYRKCPRLDNRSNRSADLPDSLGKYRRSLHRYASRRYRPKNYAGKTLLFRASTPLHRAGFSLHPQLGWPRHIHEQLQVKTISGDHLGILSAPNVAELAKHIENAISTD